MRPVFLLDPLKFKKVIMTVLYFDVLEKFGHHKRYYFN